MNSLMMIRPYKEGSVWVFDDEAVGLIREPFVGEINRFIDRLTEHILGAEKGFTLLFSSEPFPGHRLALRRSRSEFSGTWYWCTETATEGWLCPSLFKYFDVAPRLLYAKAEA